MSDLKHFLQKSKRIVREAQPSFNVIFTATYHCLLINLAVNGQGSIHLFSKERVDIITCMLKNLLKVIGLCFNNRTLRRLVDC